MVVLSSSEELRVLRNSEELALFLNCCLDFLNTSVNIVIFMPFSPIMDIKISFPQAVLDSPPLA